METSAKSSTNVTELFVAIAKKLPKTETPVSPNEQPGLILNPDGVTEPPKKKCC